MIALTFLLSHLRLAGIAAAGLALLLFLGWIGHLVEQHERDQARITLVEQQLGIAAETNQHNLADLARFKAETAKAEAALGAASARAQSRTTEIAKITSEIAHVSVPGPAPAIGPYTATALRLLRSLKADADHTPAGGKAADPAGAALLPARP
jgi:hypothetical protein